MLEPWSLGARSPNLTSQSGREPVTLDYSIPTRYHCAVLAYPNRRVSTVTHLKSVAHNAIKTSRFHNKKLKICPTVRVFCLSILTYSANIASNSGSDCVVVHFFFEHIDKGSCHTCHTVTRVRNADSSVLIVWRRTTRAWMARVWRHMATMTALRVRLLLSFVTS